MNAKNLTLIVFFLFVITSAKAVTFNKSIINSADSLFHQKQYLQAYEVYDSLYKAGIYSESMLLKMAYVSEGIDKPAQAAYYLSVMNSVKYSDAVTARINEIARDNGYAGFTEESDLRLFVWMKKWWRPLLAATILVSIIFIIVFAQRNYVTYCFSLVLIVVAFILMNKSIQGEGMVLNNVVMKRSGPSNGAEVIGEMEVGSKFTILSEEESWLKVSMLDETFYVFKDGVKRI